MNKSQVVEALENRTERHTSEQAFDTFEGMAETLKEQRYSQKEASLSEYQNFLYKRAMYGLKMYSEEEIKKMHWQKRNRIKKVQSRTQIMLNTWKQRKMVDISNEIFALFHKSSLAQEVIELYSEPDPTYICNMSFKDLGITKFDVIERMVGEGLLPYNFRKLKEANS